MDYYGSSYYWGGPYLWGTVSFPEDLAIPVETQPLIADRRSADSHLRSTAAVTGYHVEASDGEIGHVENFLTDQGTWKIRYLDVKTRNWLPGQKVLLSSAWVVGVSRAKSRVSVGLSRETIKSTPEYIESRPITTKYENQLHLHCDKRPYGFNELKHDIRRFNKGVCCTRLIESAFSIVETICRNVKCWRDGDHNQRWLVRAPGRRAPVPQLRKEPRLPNL